MLKNKSLTLSNVCSNDVILSSNTSTIPIGQIAQWTDDQQRFKLGMILKIIFEKTLCFKISKHGQ